MEKFHGALPLSILLDFLVKSHNAVSDAILGKLGTDSGEMLAVVVQFDGFLIFPFFKHGHLSLIILILINLIRNTPLLLVAFFNQLRSRLEVILLNARL